MKRYEEFLEVRKQEDKMHELRLIGYSIEEIILQIQANMTADGIKAYDPQGITVKIKDEPKGYKGQITVKVTVDGID